MDKAEPCAAKMYMKNRIIYWKHILENSLESNLDESVKNTSLKTLIDSCGCAECEKIKGSLDPNVRFLDSVILG
jgi:hypothetical protein